MAKGGRKPSPIQRLVTIVNGIAKCMFCDGEDGALSFQLKTNSSGNGPATRFANHLIFDCDGCPDSVKYEIMQTCKTSK